MWRFVATAATTLCATAGCRDGSPGATAPPPPDGAAVFEMACSRCHGPTGAGDGPLAAKFGPVPHLNEPTLPERYARPALEAFVRDGRGKMPPHEARLTADEISAVAGFVERRFFRRP